jgi:four helix bundle protein
MNNGAIKDYRDLLVWQRAKKLVVLVYKATEKFPREEIYGLISQMRRAAISIPSNIAEGFRRRSVKEKINFLRMADGSGAELQTQLDISNDLGYLSEDEYRNFSQELEIVMKMIGRAIYSIGSK